MTLTLQQTDSVSCDFHFDALACNDLTMTPQVTEYLYLHFSALLPYSLA